MRLNLFQSVKNDHMRTVKMPCERANRLALSPHSFDFLSKNVTSIAWVFMRPCFCTFALRVKSYVLRVLNHSKIFCSIVISYAIEMVNGFMGKKFPSKALFHYIPMLKYSSFSIDVFQNVSVDRSCATAAPERVAFSPD